MWDIIPERDEEWFQKTTNNMSKRQIAQEYLYDFTTSGDTFMSEGDIEWIRDKVSAPVAREYYERNVWIWN